MPRPRRIPRRRPRPPRGGTCRARAGARSTGRPAGRGCRRGRRDRGRRRPAAATALPFTRSAAAAISSATHGMVTTSGAALGIRPAAQILEDVHAGGADRGVGLALAPCAAERVRDDARRPRRRAAIAQARRQGAGRGIRIHRQQQHGAVRGVRGIDARRRPRRCRAGSARCGWCRRSGSGDVATTRTVSAVIASSRSSAAIDAAFGLRHDLRRHHEDVAVGECAGSGIRDHADEIRAGGDLGNALERPGLQHVRRVSGRTAPR